MDANQLGLYSASAMSDEERVAILADIILEAIGIEEARAVEAEE
jgi:hypothetical protein